MIITNINNRADWFMAVLTRGNHRTIGHGTSVAEAIGSVMTQVYALRPLPVLFVESAFDIEMTRFVA